MVSCKHEGISRESPLDKTANINFTARETEVRRVHLNDLAALENSTTALQLVVLMVILFCKQPSNRGHCRLNQEPGFQEFMV